MSDSLRSKLLTHCKTELDSKIDFLQSEFKLYSESAANETKSTAGDKHDTSKSMMQLEQEKMGAQLQTLLKLKKTLNTIETMANFERPGLGSIIRTDQSNFFISIFSKAVQIDNHLYNPISIQSPIALELLNCKVGDSIQFNGKAYSNIVFEQSIDC